MKVGMWLPVGEPHVQCLIPYGLFTAALPLYVQLWPMSRNIHPDVARHPEI